MINIFNKNSKKVLKGAKLNLKDFQNLKKLFVNVG